MRMARSAYIFLAVAAGAAVGALVSAANSPPANACTVFDRHHPGIVRPSSFVLGAAVFERGAPGNADVGAVQLQARWRTHWHASHDLRDARCFKQGSGYVSPGHRCCD